LFSPADSVAELRAEQRANRKTRVQPSQANRKKNRPRRRPGDCYDVSSYGRAIRRACVEADAKAHKEHPEIPADEVIVPSWHPNQLRHLRATILRRECGLDTARIVLGHRSPEVTEVYAEIDVNKAVEIMGRLVYAEADRERAQQVMAEFG
jgi:integrase